MNITREGKLSGRGICQRGEMSYTPVSGVVCQLGHFFVALVITFLLMLDKH